MSKTLKFNTVLFDVDSTLVSIEGLAEIARKKDVYDAVVAVTHEGMNGTMSFSHSLKQRLDLVNPSREDVQWLNKKYVEHIVPGARETIHQLQFEGIEVHMISGAYVEALQLLADTLGIPHENIHALELLFDDNGAYTGIDESQVLLQDNGKLITIQQNVFTRAIAFIGDGVTDLETKVCVDRFIGYGGVVDRPVVKEQAEYYTQSTDLRDVLQWLEIS